MSAAKAKDFSNAFILIDTIPFSVDFLYQWLVSNDVNTEVMEELVIAVQDEEVQQILDISSVQMFISRTKERCSPRKSIQMNDENDDEDEI